MLNKKAFTLVELIVSIAIFGVIMIAAMAMLQSTAGIFKNADSIQKYESIASVVTDYIHSKVKIADQVAIMDYAPPTTFPSNLSKFNKIFLDSNGLISFNKQAEKTNQTVFSPSFFQDIHLEISFSPNSKYIVREEEKILTWSKNSIQLTVKLKSNSDKKVVLYSKSSTIDLENAKLEFLTNHPIQPPPLPPLPPDIDDQDRMPKSGNTICFIPNI